MLVLIILLFVFKVQSSDMGRFRNSCCIISTLAVMLLTGQSINMISLFALIMMLGIIVDDSIVVAEHIDYQYDRTKNAYEASFIGASKMLGPVTAASLTTVAGFAPVFLNMVSLGKL